MKMQELIDAYHTIRGLPLGSQFANTDIARHLKRKPTQTAPALSYLNQIGVLQKVAQNGNAFIYTCFDKTLSDEQVKELYRELRRDEYKPKAKSEQKGGQKRKSKQRVVVSNLIRVGEVEYTLSEARSVYEQLREIFEPAQD